MYLLLQLHLLSRSTKSIYLPMNPFEYSLANLPISYIKNVNNFYDIIHYKELLF